MQKFVLETCKGVEGHKTFIEEFVASPDVFEANLERRVALGWYLRQAGPRWSSIQLLACAMDYCSTFDSLTARRTEEVEMDVI